MWGMELKKPLQGAFIRLCVLCGVFAKSIQLSTVSCMLQHLNQCRVQLEWKALCLRGNAMMWT